MRCLLVFATTLCGIGLMSGPAAADDRTPTKTIIGRVVDEDGKPVADAVVHGVYSVERVSGSAVDATTDAEGRFTSETAAAPQVLHARSADGAIGAIVETTAEHTDLLITLKPTTTARGRLVDAKGKPVADALIFYGLTVEHGRGGHGMWYGWPQETDGTTKTGAEGDFTLTGLARGWRHRVFLVRNPEDFGSLSFRRLTTIAPKDAEPIELGDTLSEPRPEPAPPPTREQRIAQFFDAGVPFAERLEQAKREARRELTRVLIVLGDPDEESGGRAVDLLEGDRKVARSLRGFERVSANTYHPKAMAAVREVAGEETAKLPEPVLIVLDGDGKVAGTWSGGDRETEADAESVLKFLESHAATVPDAEALLGDALRRAGAEDKRVFLMETAPWCGPCRRLARFLEGRKELFGPDYILVRIDAERFANGDAVMRRFRTPRDDNKPGGIPWFAILDADARILATSDGPDGNIAFPTEYDEIVQFVGILERTARRMSEEQRETIREALRAR